MGRGIVFLPIFVSNLLMNDKRVSMSELIEKYFRTIKRNLRGKYRMWYLPRKKVVVERDLSFQNLQTAQSCLLFAMAETVEMDVVEKVQKIFPKHITVDVLFWALEPTVYLPGVTYVEEKSFSNSGEISDSKLHNVLQTPYDILIDLSTDPCVEGDFILKQSLAKCKIGMSRKGFQGDVVFEAVKDMDHFILRLSELLKNVKNQSE